MKEREIFSEILKADAGYIDIDDLYQKIKERLLDDLTGTTTDGKHVFISDKKKRR